MFSARILRSVVSKCIKAMAAVWGGTTATHNSIEYSNESYDAKTRTVTMHAVIDWSDPYRFGDSTGSFTAPDITVVFDKSGKIQRIDSTVWGFPPAR